MPFTEAFKHQTEADIRRVLRENIQLTTLEDVRDYIQGLYHLLDFELYPHPTNPHIKPAIDLLDEITDKMYVQRWIKPHLLPAYTPSFKQSISDRWHRRTQEEKEDIAVNKYIDLVTDIFQKEISRLEQMSSAKRLALIARFNQPASPPEAKHAREEKPSRNPAIGFYSSATRTQALDFMHTHAIDQMVVMLHGIPLKSFARQATFFHSPSHALLALQAPLPQEEVAAGVRLLLHTVALESQASTLMFTMAKHLLDQGVVPAENGTLEYKVRGLRR